MTFQIEKNVPIPVDVKESKYPWGEMEEGDSFVAFSGSELDCNTRRQAVHASGRNYYDKRNIPLHPHVRVVEEDGTYVVRAWVKSDPDVEGEE